MSKSFILLIGLSDLIKHPEHFEVYVLVSKRVFLGQPEDLHIVTNLTANHWQTSIYSACRAVHEIGCTNVRSDYIRLK